MQQEHRTEVEDLRITICAARDGGRGIKVGWELVGGAKGRGLVAGGSRGGSDSRRRCEHLNQQEHGCERERMVGSNVETTYMAEKGGEWC